jgi:hypothetical protein
MQPWMGPSLAEACEAPMAVPTALARGLRTDSTFRPYSDVDAKRTLNALCPAAAGQRTIRNEYSNGTVGQRYRQRLEILSRLI